MMNELSRLFQNRPTERLYRPLGELCEPKASLVTRFNKGRRDVLRQKKRFSPAPHDDAPGIDIRTAAPGTGLMKIMKFDRHKKFSPITLFEMQPLHAYPDTVLHATVLTPPLVGRVGTTVVIEDTAGHAIVLCVYKNNACAFDSQAAADRAFPVGRKIAIFEPYAKLDMTLADALIRVDDPREIETLEGDGAAAARGGQERWQAKKGEANALVALKDPNFALAADLYRDAIAAVPGVENLARALHNLALAERRAGGEGEADFFVLMHAAACVDTAYEKPASYLTGKAAPSAADLELSLPRVLARRAQAPALPAPGDRLAARDRGNEAFKAQDFPAACEAYAAAVYGDAAAARDTAILLANTSYVSARTAAFDAAARYAVAALVIDPTYDKACLRWHAASRGTQSVGRLILSDSVAKTMAPAMRKLVRAEEARSCDAAAAAALMREVASAMEDEVGVEVGSGDPTFCSLYTTRREVEEKLSMNEEMLGRTTLTIGLAEFESKAKEGDVQRIGEMVKEAQAAKWPWAFLREHSTPAYVPPVAVACHESVMRRAFFECDLQRRAAGDPVLQQGQDNARRLNEGLLLKRFGLCLDVVGAEGVELVKALSNDYKPGELMRELHMLHRENNCYETKCAAWHPISNSESPDVTLLRGELYIFAGCSDLSPLLRASISGSGTAPAAVWCVDDSPASCAKMLVVSDLLQHGAAAAALEVWLSNLWSREATDAFHAAAARVLAARDGAGLDARVVWLLSKWTATEAVAPGEAVLQWVRRLEVGDVIAEMLLCHPDRMAFLKYLQAGRYPLGDDVPEVYSGSICSWATPKNDTFREAAPCSVLAVMVHRDFIGAASFAAGVNGFFSKAVGRMADAMRTGRLSVERVACSKVEDLQGSLGGRPLGFVSWNNIFDYVPAEAAAALMCRRGRGGGCPYGAAREHLVFSMNAAQTLQGTHPFDYDSAAGSTLQQDVAEEYAANIAAHGNPELFSPTPLPTKASTVFGAAMLRRYVMNYARAAFAPADGPPRVHLVSASATSLQDLTGFGSVHMRFATTDEAGAVLGTA